MSSPSYSIQLTTKHLTLIEPLLSEIRTVEGVTSNEQLFTRAGGICQLTGQLVLRASRFQALTKQIVSLKRKNKSSSELDKKVVIHSRKSISQEVKEAKKAAAEKRRMEKKKAKEEAKKKKEAEKAKKQKEALSK